MGLHKQTPEWINEYDNGSIIIHFMFVMQIVIITWGLTDIETVCLKNNPLALQKIYLLNLRYLLVTIILKRDIMLLTLLIDS